MAGLGMTKLQAINMMLLAVGQMRVSALDSSGSSDAAEAEYFLDLVVEEIIAEGHPSTTRVVTLTASAGGEIDLSSLASLAIRVQGTGAYRHRSFSIRGVKIYDEDAGATACFGNAEEVSLEIFEKVSASSPANFEELAPDLKHKVVHRATAYYRARKKPDQLVDGLLLRDAQRTELTSSRNPPAMTMGAQGPLQYAPADARGGGR